MSTKIIEVFECDCGCGRIDKYGTLPDGWVWGIETVIAQRINPARRSEMITDEKRAERHFATEACAKRYEKEHHTKIERPVVNESV